MVSSTLRPHFTPGKDLVPILQEAGWAPGPVWTGAENLVPTGIRSRTVNPVAQSLYRLSYRDHTHFTGVWVGPRTGLDRCGKSRPHRDSIPDRPPRSSVAIPTELPGPHLHNNMFQKICCGISYVSYTVG